MAINYLVAVLALLIPCAYAFGVKVQQERCLAHQRRINRFTRQQRG